MTVRSAYVAQAINARDAMLVRNLRELGPGWALGYRIKEELAVPPLATRLDGHYTRIEWELRLVRVEAGTIPMSHDGFHYVTLRDFNDAPR